MADYQLDYEAMNENDGEKKKNSAGEELFEWIETIIFGFFVMVLFFTFVFRIANVDGPSMIPTLINGEKLVVSYHFYTPDNGDIVIVKAGALKKLIVKRVIATAGQTVNIDFAAGTVSVDGVVLDEPYVNTPTNLDEGAFDYPVTVPDGCVFIMGDNRNDSADSRDPRVGFVPEEDIMGRVVLRLTPINKFGTVH